jgi:Fungal specific transcription factor domain
MAQDLGLHRDPATWMESYPVLQFSREEVEVRRRTWWAVYIVDKCSHI